MSEIFLRERPEHALNFTGERLTTAVAGQIEIEHLHRYFLARTLVRGKDVLEIACGEGYGAAILAQVARSVLAVDVSDEAVAHAQQAYRKPNLTFRAGDARRIDAPDASADVVVSFETLEHIWEHELFYKEIRRVLRLGGVLIISTPDRDVYSPDGSVANRYHIRELTQAEFLNGLRQVFPYSEVLLQRPMLGSLMLPISPASGMLPPLTFEQRGPDAFEANQGLPRALYFVAYASDQPVTLPAASAYIETSQLALREGEVQRRLHEARIQRDEATLASAARMSESEMLRGQLADAQADLAAEAERQRAAQSELGASLAALTATRGELTATQEELTATQEELISIRAELATAREGLTATRAELTIAKRELNNARVKQVAIESSNSWRVTAPMRALVSRMRVLLR